MFFKDGFMVGAIVASVLLFAAFVFSDESEVYDNTLRLIAECEADLPRNETCMIIAVPKE